MQINPVYFKNATENTAKKQTKNLILKICNAQLRSDFAFFLRVLWG